MSDIYRRADRPTADDPGSGPVGPGHAVRPEHAVRLPTADGELLYAEVWPGPPGAGHWIVVAHGFSGSTAEPALRRVVSRLTAYAGVLSYDARGHGRSSGRTTLGDREVLDVDAAVSYLRAVGGRHVVTLGFSMGAAAVVRHAAAVAGYGLAERPDAVVVVSGTGPWSTRATASRSMRRLHLLVETRLGRTLTRALLHTRVDPRGWPVPPVAPADCVADVEVPLLLVHGDHDGYLGLEHPRALADRSGAPLWVEAGFGHAEIAISDDLVDGIGAHVARLLDRRGPDRTSRAD